MNIWLVSIFEQTPVDQVFSTRFLSIANEALERGHQVSFFGSTFKHNTKNQRFEETTVVKQADNYQLVFIKSLSYQKNISIKRLMSHYFFSHEAIKLLDDYPKPDIILLAFPPVSLAYELSKWAKRNDIPLVMDIIDPWPDIFEHALPARLAFLGKFLFWIPKYKLKRTLANVQKLTAISNQYLQWAKEYYAVEQVECLYPAADFSVTQEYINTAEPIKGFSDKKLKVIYAGSLASSYDLETILKAAETLNKYRDIHFFVAGSGPKEVIVRQYCDKYDNLTYLGRLPKGELMSYYASSDLGMTQHIKGATQSVTYKLFDLLSSGLPILNSLESEMCEIIVDNKVGLHNTPGDFPQLAKNILTFYEDGNLLEKFKANALQLAKEIGDTKVIYKRFVDVLEENASL